MATAYMSVLAPMLLAGSVLFAGTVLATRVAAADPPAGDAPLQPRQESPDEAAERARWPRFLTPAELRRRDAAARASAGAPATAAPSADRNGAPPPASASAAPPPVPPARPPRLFPSPNAYVRARGMTRDWVGETFLAEPDRHRFLTFDARGGYSLATQQDDFSSVDLAATAGIAEGFSGAAAFHHENRDEPGELGVLSLVATVIPHYYVVSSVAFGGGAHYLPITQLDLDLRATMFAYQQLGLSFGTAWLTQERTRTRASVTMSWLAGWARGDLRLGASLLDAPDAPLFFLPHVRLLGQAGRHRHRTYEIDLGASLAPQYVPRAPLASLDSRFVFDVAAGVRHWLDRRYGVALRLELASEVRGFSRVGFDAAVFATPF